MRTSRMRGGDPIQEAEDRAYAENQALLLGHIQAQTSKPVPYMDRKYSEHDPNPSVSTSAWFKKRQSLHRLNDLTNAVRHVREMRSSRRLRRQMDRHFNKKSGGRRSRRSRR